MNPYRLIHTLIAIAAVAALGLTGCESVVQESCSVVTLDDGSGVMTCPDGTEHLISNGLDGIGGQAGLNGMSCTVVDNTDGTFTMNCPDGTELTWANGANGTDGKDGKDGITDPIVDPTQPITEDDLSIEEQQKIDVLRVAIDSGLEIGKKGYIETLSVSLQSAGVADDYEGQLNEDFSGVDLEVESCPFVKYMTNGFQPTGYACDFLADLAKVEAYADLTSALGDEPLAQDILDGDHADEAIFWYEQGAISGIEQHRVLVRSDLKAQLICNTEPTPHESSYDKGLVVGMQSLAESFNNWLDAQGHTADYPTMSNPIIVCNINASLLDPAKQEAINKVPATRADNPLCDDYQPPTQQLALDYAQADVEYEQGIKAGINAEFALAAVRIFKQVPCNVSDPLVLDLDGDGIEVSPIHQGVNFDLYAVGTAQAAAWPSPDDGFLAMDRNGNGAIDNGTELFGNVDVTYAHGFEHLATLDDNGDGLLTAADAAFGQLVVWQDVNHDGASTAAELHSLASLGITAIPAEGSEVSMRSNGIRIPVAAEVLTTHGTMLIGDAFLTTAPYASPSL